MLNANAAFLHSLQHPCLFRTMSVELVLRHCRACIGKEHRFWPIWKTRRVKDVLRCSHRNDPPPAAALRVIFRSSQSSYGATQARIPAQSVGRALTAFDIATQPAASEPLSHGALRHLCGNCHGCGVAALFCDNATEYLHKAVLARTRECWLSA
jgi:hypothetical protein